MCYVKSKLKSLKTNKATGLDNISARLLKHSADAVSTSLTKIYNRSLATSIFPTVWKCGKVTALFLLHLLTLESRHTLVNSLVMPIFDYADFVWGDKNNSVLMDHLHVLHNKAAKIILDAHPLWSASESLQLLNWQPLSIRRHFHRCHMMYRCLNNIVDFKLNFQNLSDIHSYNTRNKRNLHLDHVKRNWGKQAFTYHAANDWNSLPVELRQIELFTSFKIKLKKHLTQLDTHEN